MGKILVTGATGKVGSEVVKLLSEKKIPVIAGVRSKEKAKKLLGDVEAVEIDLENPKTLQNAFFDVEKVFLITHLTSNIVGVTKNVIKPARKAGVKFIVRLSLMGADHMSNLNLAQWHWHGDKHIKKSGIPYAILRPGIFMQNFISYYAQGIKEQNLVVSTGGDAKISFVDVRDIAKVAVKVLTSEGHNRKIYTITGDTPMTYAEMTEIISKTLGKDLKYVNVSDQESKQSMVKLGLSNWMANAFVGLGQKAREGEFERTTKVVEDLTGDKPKSAYEFAKDYAHYWS